MMKEDYLLEKIWMLDAERIRVNFVAGAKFTSSM